MQLTFGEANLLAEKCVYRESPFLKSSLKSGEKRIANSLVKKGALIETETHFDVTEVGRERAKSIY